MHQYVKVKIVSLSNEAKYIKKQENKRLRQAARARAQGKHDRAEYHSKNYLGMKEHRVVDIRREARASFIAYGFLRGKKYSEIERNAYTQPNWYKVESIVKTYGELQPLDARMARFQTWKAEALAGETEKKLWFNEPRPRSVRGFTSWLLRLFQGNLSAYLKWLREIHPKKDTNENQRSNRSQ